MREMKLSKAEKDRLQIDSKKSDWGGREDEVACLDVSGFRLYM